MSLFQVLGARFHNCLYTLSTVIDVVAQTFYMKNLRNDTDNCR